MESRLKKLSISQIRKVYCIMMKHKKTSLSKNNIISKLLQPLQKKYRINRLPKSNDKNRIKKLEKKIANKLASLNNNRTNHSLNDEILRRKKEWSAANQILKGLPGNLKTRGGKRPTGPSQIDKFLTQNDIKNLVTYGDEENQKYFEKKLKAYQLRTNIKSKKNDLKSPPLSLAPPLGLRRHVNIPAFWVHGSEAQSNIPGIDNDGVIPAQLISRQGERYMDHKQIYELYLPVPPYNRIRISYDPNTGEYTRIDSSSYFKKADAHPYSDGF